MMIKLKYYERAKHHEQVVPSMPSYKEKMLTKKPPPRPPRHPWIYVVLECEVIAPIA